jgi:hypothetical protein
MSDYIKHVMTVASDIRMGASFNIIYILTMVLNLGHV